MNYAPYILLGLAVGLLVGSVLLAIAWSSKVEITDKNE